MLELPGGGVTAWSLGPDFLFMFRAQSGVSQSSEQRSKISQTVGLRAEVTEVVQVRAGPCSPGHLPCWTPGWSQ